MGAQMNLIMTVICIFLLQINKEAQDFIVEQYKHLRERDSSSKLKAQACRSFFQWFKTTYF